MPIYMRDLDLVDTRRVSLSKLWDLLELHVQLSIGYLIGSGISKKSPYARRLIRIYGRLLRRRKGN